MFEFLRRYRRKKALDRMLEDGFIGWWLDAQRRMENAYSG